MATTPFSHFIRTVCLKDWWLTRADNNSFHNTVVAVAGIESTGQKAARVFVSAPIVKRLDLFTLKTADGIFVLLFGLINKERTCENGFSAEVFKHFLVGFPSNWENCAEKCLQQGIGSEATLDADLNPDEAQEATTELQDDQNIDSVEERKDLDSNNTPEHFTDEAQEATIELQDDQNIELVEERSFRDARSDAQSHDKDRHATVSVHDGDACVDADIHDSNVGFREEGVRYSLRNRKVPYFEAKGACKGKRVKNVAKSKSVSKKTTISADISTIPSVVSLENSKTPGMAPLCDESSKENAEHPNFAVSGGVNDANHAENIAASRPLSLSGEALTVDNSMHRIKDPQKSHTRDDMAPILQDASKANNLISHHSFVGKSCESKKRKRIERRTLQKNIVSTKSLLKKTGESTNAFAMTLVTALSAQWDLAKSGRVAVEGNNTENQNVRGEDESKQTLDHLRSARVNTKKRSIREASILVETNIGFSTQDAEKFVNSTSHDICIEKSLGSKKERKQSCILTRTIADIKNCHDSARPTPRTCTSKAKSNSKAAAPGMEGKASTGSTRKLKTRRELDYVEKTSCAAEGGNETPTSQSSVTRTSRSGRLLLPTMEFWRNQLPIYDADHGISGIKEGSTILKLKRGGKSCTNF